MADIIITNEKYKSGFVLDEYKGTYSLINAYQKKTGEVEKKWAFIEKREKNEDTGEWEGKAGKKLPWKIELGTRDEAIKHLRDALEQLGAELPGPERLPEGYPIEGGNPEYEDIPY